MEPVPSNIQPLLYSPLPSTHFLMLQEIGWKGDEANAKQFYEAVEKTVNGNFIFFMSVNILETDPIVVIKNFHALENDVKTRALIESKELLTPSFTSVLEHNQVWIFEIYGLIFGFDNLQSTGCITSTDLANESRFTMMDVQIKYGFNFAQSVDHSAVLAKVKSMSIFKNQQIYINGLLKRGIDVLDQSAYEGRRFKKQVPAKSRIQVPLLLTDLRGLGWKGRDCDYLDILKQMKEELEAFVKEYPEQRKIYQSKISGQINVIAGVKNFRAAGSNERSYKGIFFAPRLYDYIRSNNLIGVTSLLLIGGNTWLCGHIHMSPLQYAAKYLKPDVIRLLLQYEMKLTVDIVGLLPERVSTEEEANLFIEILEIINRETSYPNFYAAYQMFLLSIGIDSFKLLSHLIEQGCDATQALKIAIARKFPNKLATIQYLLESGANPEKFFGEKSCLDYALDSTVFEPAIARLIFNGVNIDNVDGAGKTLLMRVVRQVNLQMKDLDGPYGPFELLLESPNINLEAVTRDGYTVLRYACLFPDLAIRHAIVKRLLKAGANPNALAFSGVTLLNFVAELEPFDETLFRMLIEEGADVDQQERLEGRTLIMRLVSYYSTSLNSDKKVRKIATILVEEGANLELKDRGGKTARDIALYCYATDWIQFIDEALKLTRLV